MFAFLATLGPVGIGIAVVGTVATAAYAYMKDDENSEDTKSNTADINHRKEKNTIIKNEIEKYKNSQINRLNNKYDVNIEFNSNKIIISDTEINNKFEYISRLENDIQELSNLIFQLERIKNESKE
jgi:hypothetical protein